MSKSSKKGPRESTIVDAIREDLKQRPGVLFKKDHVSCFTSKGWPDISVIFSPENTPKNRTGSFSGPALTVYLEVKRIGQNPTENQRTTIERLKRCKAYVEVVRSKKEAIDYLESLGLPEKRKEVSDVA